MVSETPQDEAKTAQTASLQQVIDQLRSRAKELQASAAGGTTTSLGALVEDLVSLTELFGLMLLAAEGLDDFAARLVEATKLDTPVAKKIADQQGVGAARILARHERLVMHLVLVRAVDLFLTYLSDIMALVFRTRPETLRSSETVRVEEILQYPDMSELVSAIADKRVTDLSYKGMHDLSLYLEQHMGLQLFTSSDELKDAVVLVEMRNLLTHNRGIVNRIAITKVPEFAPFLGQPIELKPETITKGLLFLVNAAASIDLRAIDKFGLPST